MSVIITIPEEFRPKEPSKEVPGKLVKKRTLRDFFNSSQTKVWLSYHDRGFQKAPKKTLEEFKKNHGFELHPRLWIPITVGWSEKGRGFGEYTFWQENGKIHCANECDSRESVKRVLCNMVDQAVFEDDPKPKRLK
jgi:hypothetical protein